MVGAAESPQARPSVVAGRGEELEKKQAVGIYKITVCLISQSKGVCQSCLVRRRLLFGVGTVGLEYEYFDVQLTFLVNTKQKKLL